MKRQAEIARIEERLGVRLPEEYRAAWLADRSFTAVEAWQLRFPSELCWCADADIPFLENIRGVLLGENIGGDALVYMLASDKQLSDKLHVVHHESGEAERLYQSFTDLLDE